MKNLLKFQVALDKASEYAPLLVGDGRIEFDKQAEYFLEEVRNTQYIKVPIVGVFSAGKSSLLNIFTEKPGMLPVDTEPETAVAYELYFCEKEIVELYRADRLIDTKSLSDIKLLDTKPGDIAKVYCNSEPVKKLQEKGIVLVDMPGIGSGIERHDAAIMNYISSGTAFVLLVDVEQGSLRGSTLSFMHELSQYNLHPAVLVSKIDKKSDNDVNDVVEYVQYQMSKMGDKTPFVSTVSSVNNNLEGFNQYIDSLDYESLISAKYGKKLSILLNSIIDQLKIRVDLRTKDITNADEKLIALEEEIANVKVEIPASESDAETPEKSTQDILANVRAALEAKSVDIAQMIIDKEDQESIKSVIVSTVRTEVIRSLKEESEQYSTALGSVVQAAVQELSTIEVDNDFMSDFSDIIDLVYGYIDEFVSVGGVWGEIAQFLLPFLPDLMNWLFGKSDDEIFEEVRQKVMTKCVNQVVNGLQPTILKITLDNQKKIQEKLQAELISQMEKVKEGLREKIADANKSIEEVQLELNSLNDAISHLEDIKANI